MRKNLKLMTLGTALLLLAAACTQGENEPGAEPEGKITLTPTVGLSAGWNTGADTRADQKVPVALAAGGNVALAICKVGTDGTADMNTMCANFYEVTAEGKLSRLPFSGEQGETEDALNVAAPGEYYVIGHGMLNCVTDGITYRAIIANNSPSNPDGAKMIIGGDGKLAVPCQIQSGGLRLNVKGTDGAAYAGADVTATLRYVRGISDPLETKTLTAAAPSVIWGDIDFQSSVTAGWLLFELGVDGRTYEVNAPRQISFTAGRLYTFNVRVGATSITVSSDDLSIGDFEVQASTGAEADNIPHYNGQPAKLLAIPGRTAYWVAPVDAATDVVWSSVNFSTICPEGWHVPTRDEFIAMSGMTGGTTQKYEGWETFNAAFPSPPNDPPPDVYYYWTSDSWTPPSDGSDIRGVALYAAIDGIAISAISKTEVGRVRCVRKK